MKLFLLEHPDIKTPFILTSKSKVKSFLKNNVYLWKEYKVNEKSFSVREVLVKDSKLLIVLKENMPELFL